MPLNENQIFWNNMERIKDTLLFTDSELAISLGLSPELYLKFRQSAHMLPLNSVFEFAEKMNFHFEDLLTENFKLSLFCHKETEMPLPERYSFATYSEIRPIRNIINYLENVRGLRAKTNLIRKFQLTEEFFNRENQKVNIFLISDITSYLKKTYNFTEAEFIAMGHRTPHVIKGSFLKDKLSTQDNIEDIVSCFFEECTQLFDENYDYKITGMTYGQATIDATPKKHVIEELGIINLSDFSNEHACLTRLGVLSSITYFKYGRNAPVTKTSSVLSGDKANRYVLDMTSFKKTRLSLVESSYLLQ